MFNFDFDDTLSGSQGRCWFFCCIFNKTWNLQQKRVHAFLKWDICLEASENACSCAQHLSSIVIISRQFQFISTFFVVIFAVVWVLFIYLFIFYILVLNGDQQPHRWIGFISDILEMVTFLWRFPYIINLRCNSKLGQKNGNS